MGRKKEKNGKEKDALRNSIEDNVNGAKVFFYGGTRAGNGLSPGLYVMQQPGDSDEKNILMLKLKTRANHFKGSEVVGISYSECRDIAFLIDALIGFNKEKYGIENNGNGLSTRDITNTLRRYGLELKIGGLGMLDEIFVGPGIYQVDMPEDNCLRGVAVAYTMPIATGISSICLPGVKIEAVGRGVNYIQSELIQSMLD